MSKSNCQFQILKKSSQLYAMEAGRQNKGLIERVFRVKVHFLTHIEYYLTFLFDLIEFGSFGDNKVQFPGTLQ